MVAPYSGAMLAMVARSGRLIEASPGPVNSTNLPTTPCARSSSTTANVTSVAVVPGWRRPMRRTPTTSGVSMSYGCPSRAASASMPPTPQPSTPRPLIMVVCESVPTRVSGYTSGAGEELAASCGSTITTLARYSRFTWCTMPVAGGTTRKLANALCPQCRNSKRSRLRLNSIFALRASASAEPKWSTCTEWSITRSIGACGLTPDGSPPSRAMAARMAPRSTTAGTPVRSCMITRAGRYGRLGRCVARGCQAANSSTCSRVTRPAAHPRSSDSSRMRNE